MKNYVVLLRGINVGGKNKIPMKELKTCLEENGFHQVSSYIQSGNIVLQSRISEEEISSKIENIINTNFELDSSIIRVLSIDSTVYHQIISSAPKDFGEDNENYRYEVIFLIDVLSEKAMIHVDIRENVDNAWQGEHVIYYRRPGPKHPDYTKTYISKLTKKDVYQSMTIRNWNTVKKLLGLLESLPELNNENFKSS